MQSASHSRPDGTPATAPGAVGAPRSEVGDGARGRERSAAADRADEAEQPTIPDYGGAWIGGVLPALAVGRAPQGAPEWVTDRELATHGGLYRTSGVAQRQYVVLLVDGLGWQLYHRFAAHLPSLARFDAAPISAVVPATTASALPSVTTGLAPAEHGMLGDRMRVAGAVLNVLRWTVSHGAVPDPAAVQPHRPFAHGPVDVVSNAEYEGSGFTISHLRGVRYSGYGDADGLANAVGARLDAGARIVYAYLPNLDRTAHEVGFDDDAFGDALALTDRVITDVLRRLPPGGVLLVTADHGHVEAPRDARVELDALANMVSATAGSARMRYLHARPGAARDLLAATKEIAGERAWVVDRATVVRHGWMGPDMSPIVAGRLGDVVVAARGDVTFGDPLAKRPKFLVTEHGSLTPAEVMVPLLAARADG